jgi:hypothetical protein
VTILHLLMYCADSPLTNSSGMHGRPVADIACHKFGTLGYVISDQSFSECERGPNAGRKPRRRQQDM